MGEKPGMRRARFHCVCWILLLTGLVGTVASAPSSREFRVDDPHWVDPDDLPIPMPRERDIAQLYDFLESTFLRRPGRNESIPEAENINTLGEVPDSSWFTNRIGRRILTLDELVIGPSVSGGPAGDRPWTVIAAKTQGITPGFRMRDGNGVVFFMKFDPLRNPQLATSTEVIATKFFWAFGYHVPENYLTYLRRGDLVVSPEAKLTDEEGKERDFTEGDLDQIFSRMHRGPDGRTPVLASRRLPGRPLGPFRYHGTRSDDPNDVFPHENRRELRGLRLFAAWLNHDDSRSVNTLDMYLGEPGQGHVRHNLIDFGSCLGSGSVKVQSRRAGNEYILEWGPILKAALTLGIRDRSWRHVHYPDFPAIGRFEGDYFRPELWRPEYPNPAFERMLPEDAFWAAKIILRFTDEIVRAIVRTGEIEDPAAEEYLTRTLIQRRDKIVRHYLPLVAPFDEFAVEPDPLFGRRLVFRDLGAEAGVEAPSPFVYRWFRFENRTGRMEPLAVEASVDEAAIPVPDDESEFLAAEIARAGSGRTVRVYLRNVEGVYAVVGLDRASLN
jgi:hypothetical protein